MMRYALVPENPSEARLLESTPFVRMLFDPFLPVIQAKALIAAMRMGIFEVLGSDPRTADEVAAALSLDPKGVMPLLNVLVCAGYLVRKGRHYQVTADTEPLAAWIRFNEIHWMVIARMEEVVRSGETVDVNGLLAAQNGWDLCQRAMLETARPAAQWVSARVPIPKGARRMLDLGGGHGLYGATICRAHPSMHAEVLELPEAVGAARQLARKESIDDVVVHIEGNVLTDDLGTGSCDAVFIGNLCHHFTEQQNRDLLKRVRRALRTHGTVAVWDFKLPEPDAAPDIVAHGLALYFHLTSAARCYTPDEFTGWLVDAGFADIEAYEPPGPSQLLITGRA